MATLHTIHSQRLPLSGLRLSSDSSHRELGAAHTVDKLPFFSFFHHFS